MLKEQEKFETNDYSETFETRIVRARTCDSARTTPIEVVRFINDGGPLNKHIYIKNGAPVSDSNGHMSRGKMERLPLTDWREFGALIEKTPKNAAFGLGRLRDDIPDSIPLVTKAKLTVTPGAAARTQASVYYRDTPSLVLLDFDCKGMPPEVKQRLHECGGFVGALESICAGLPQAGYIKRLSTSAGVHNRDTGEEYHLSNGVHLYLLVQNGLDAERFLYRLHDRAWLGGLGWHLVGRDGQLLERSVVDRSVYAPERLVFEAAPDLDPPVAQHERKALVHDGDAFDSQTVGDLDPEETRELKRIKADSASSLSGRCKAARETFANTKADQLGVTIDEARRIVQRKTDGYVLRPGFVLEFDNLGEVDVGAVLADPDVYIDETLADPIEGVDYGRNKGVVQKWDGALTIYSHAHGRTLYKLRYDFASIKTAILAAPEAEAAKVLARLAVHADLSPDEEDKLYGFASKRSGSSKPATKKMFKDAKDSVLRKASFDERKRKARENKRVSLQAPYVTDPLTRVMLLWDKHLLTDEPEPPMRDVNGNPVEVRERSPISFFELASESGGDAARLPAPAMPLISTHDETSLTLVLERHIDFYVENEKTGIARAASPPMKFVKHYAAYRDSKVPLVHSVATMPLVLPNDGTLLAPNGLDRKRGIVFRIDPALMTFIPDPRGVTDDDVRGAMDFIINDWFIDITAGFRDK